MSESVNIRELNDLIASKSSFVNIVTQGMDQMIVGQKHLVDLLLISLLATLPIHLMIRCPKHSVLLPASVNIPLPELILLQISLLKSQLQQEAILQRL